MAKQIVIKQNKGYQTIHATGTLTVSDDMETILLKQTADTTVVLPTAAARLGKRYTISKLDSTAFTCVVNTTNFEKINDVTTLSLTAQYDSLTIEAVDFGTPGFPSPGWVTVSFFTTLGTREETFTTALDFNRDKIVFATTATNITYTEGTRPKKYGKVITHVLTLTNDATVSFPAAFVVNGRFAYNSVNYISFVAMPNVTGDIVFATIRQKTPIVAAEGITIFGTKQVGELITAAYTFLSSYDENGTTFQWYRANSSTGSGSTPISGATSQTYTVQAGDTGKWLIVGIVPRATGFVGTETFSQWWGPIVA